LNGDQTSAVGLRCPERTRVRRRDGRRSHSHRGVERELSGLRTASTPLPQDAERDGVTYEPADLGGGFSGSFSDCGCQRSTGRPPR
jgi:hypothetical protein